MFNTMFDCFKKDVMVSELIAFMERNIEGFDESRKKYIDCINMLKAELGNAAENSVNDFDAAIHDAICILLTQSAYLGFKANLDYFENPIANNFLTVDPEIYLREGAARQLTDYSMAYAKIESFYAQLSPEIKEKTEAITDYESHLETIGPKLAHYWAFKKANSFYSHVIPGYHVPTQFTHAYEHMLSEYMGIAVIQMDELDIGFTSEAP